jgi:prepilin-type N-terminal cleavage/methylation domain-containing protein
MRIRRATRNTGFTLLETMVALTIFGLVVLGYLELLAASGRMARDSEDWSRAVAIAEDAMEVAKLDPLAALSSGETRLEDGFTRRTAYEPWDMGLGRVTVVVQLPDGRRFELHRLMAPP